ncbi:MAG: P27 family phage terminase small subunit, partial [archaeon]
REELWKWLKERNCEKLLPMLLIDQYAMSYARWIQAEQAVSEYGSLGRHPTTGNAQQSPFVMIAQNANKQTLNIWGQIYEIVKENCSSDYRPFSAADDMMERLLTSKR